MGIVLAMVLAVAAATGDDPVQLAKEAASLATAGKLSDAEAKLARAHELAPTDAAIVFNLAQVREAEGNGAAAIAAYEDYLKLAPGAKDASDVRARIARLEATSAVVPPEAQEALLKGQKLFQMSRYDDAVEAFRAAEKLAPNWGPPEYNLGLTYEQTKHWQDALDAFHRYLPYATDAEKKQLQDRIVDDEIKADDERKAEAKAHPAAPASTPGDGRIPVKVAVPDELNHDEKFRLSVEQPQGVSACPEDVTWFKPCFLHVYPGPGRVDLSLPKDALTTSEDLQFDPSLQVVWLRHDPSRADFWGPIIGAGSGLYVGLLVGFLTQHGDTFNGGGFAGSVLGFTAIGAGIGYGIGYLVKQNSPPLALGTYSKPADDSAAGDASGVGKSSASDAAPAPATGGLGSVLSQPAAR